MLIQSFQQAALLVVIYMNCVFAIAMLRKRNDLADVAWGPGFVCVALWCQFINDQYQARAILMTILVTIWAARLSLHIFSRNRGKPEDFRYRQWRHDWGKSFVVRSYLQVFILQGALLLVISAPVVFTNTLGGPSLNVLDVLGFIVWSTGFFFETVGDLQLRRFAADPANRGRILRSGLWRYTRHPNYFGEVVVWWGVYLIALSVPNGWISIIGPLTITYLLLKVSGIPMLEKKYEGNPEFEEYKRQTSTFFPLPVRR